jgi:hypothetical protein
MIRAALLLVLILAGLLAVAAPAAAVEVPPDHPIGDFNGDYYSDLAVGVPAEEVGGVYYAGAVNVVYGGPDGLRVEANQLIDQSGDVYGTPQTGALFGSALAAGDFDGDGYDDLAVGAPFYDEGGVRDGGLVVLLYGSPAGLAPREGAFRFLLVRGARYGSALAAGAFDGYVGDDLAVGAPFWTSPRARRTPEVGGVEVLYSSRFGFRRSWWTQGSPGVAQSPDPYDHFGSALAAGDFDHDLHDDLAVGAPGERAVRYGGADRAGVVQVLYGSRAGLTAEGNQLWSQASRRVASSPEEDDGFGSTLAAGDFDGDVYADLAVGAPGEEDDRCASPCPRAGAVHVLYGGEQGLAGTGAALVRPPWSWSPEDFRFGAALAAGDLDGDGADDLAVGAPGWESFAGDTLGQVRLLFGSGAGLGGGRSSDLPNPFPQLLSGYGSALSAADFDGDWTSDLAVGAPAFDVDLKHGVIVAEDGGAAIVFQSIRNEGPAPAGAREWAQGALSLLDLLGTSERGDLFGSALAP